jgi:NADH dehydrogenase [ubiquinone] 1 alpha subcomplex assembly factor 1
VSFYILYALALLNSLSLYEYLALRVRGSGDPHTRESYYVNMQTEGPISTDLWQHRLHLRRTDGGWEDIYLPFGAFRLTNSGELVDAPVKMGRDAVRSIGISLLGGNSGVQGHYDLGIDSIRVVNEQDLASEGERESEDEKSSVPPLGELGMPTPPTPSPLPTTSAS